MAESPGALSKLLGLAQAVVIEFAVLFILQVALFYGTDTYEAQHVAWLSISNVYIPLRASLLLVQADVAANPGICIFRPAR
jgi:hypothetical protein